MLSPKKGALGTPSRPYKTPLAPVPGAQVQQATRDDSPPMSPLNRPELPKHLSRIGMRPWVLYSGLATVGVLMILLVLVYLQVPEVPDNTGGKLDGDMWVTINIDEVWKSFKQQYGRTYCNATNATICGAGDTEEARFHNFKTNMKRALDSARKNPLAVMGATKFADMTAEEVGLTTAGMGAVGEHGERAANLPRISQERLDSIDRSTVHTARQQGRYKTHHRHGRVLSYRRMLAEAGKDPEGFLKKKNSAVKRHGHALQTSPNSATPSADDIPSILFIVFKGYWCAADKKYEGYYEYQGMHASGKHYYYQHSTAAYLFYDEACAGGATQPETWRLMTIPTVDPSLRQKVSGASTCKVGDFQMFFKPSQWGYTGIVPPDGERSWIVRSECTGWSWNGKTVEIRHDHKSFNWVAKGKVTGIRLQGGCGSCWAFSSIAAVESAWMIGAGSPSPAALSQTSGHAMQDLSEQFFISCELDFQGCLGGHLAQLFLQPQDEVFAEHGILNGDGWVPREGAYPLNRANTGPPCHNNPNKAIGAVMSSFEKTLTVAGVTNEYGGADDDRSPKDVLVQIALEEGGPVWVGVNTNTVDGWFVYQSGIYTNCVPLFHYVDIEVYTGDHSAIVVGYGETTWNGGEVLKYWILKNGWGPDWGESGYIRVGRAMDPPCITQLRQYISADGAECPIMSTSTETNHGPNIRQLRSNRETCHAACCDNLQCEGFLFDGAANEYGIRDCILKGAYGTTVAAPTGVDANTYYRLEQGLRSTVDCETFKFTGLDADIDDKRFYQGEAEKSLVGGRIAYWSETHYMYWCRPLSRWTIATHAQWDQNKYGPCEAVAWRSDATHYAYSGSDWVMAGGPVAGASISCGGCDSFTLAPNMPDTLWNRNPEKDLNGRPTYWSVQQAIVYMSSCHPEGWRMVPSSVSWPPVSCGYLAFPDSSTSGMPYSNRKWHSAYSGQQGWWEAGKEVQVNSHCLGDPSYNVATAMPTVSPITSQPTNSPTTLQPTISPSTSTPTTRPSTSTPTTRPSTSTPTISPSISPSTSTPTIRPSTGSPTAMPTQWPTGQNDAPATPTPTARPSTSAPTGAPTDSPLTSTPTIRPSTSFPTDSPTISPSTSTPTIRPSTSTPTASPTVPPSTAPPTVAPSTLAPTGVPTDSPSTSTPTIRPSTSTPTTRPSTSTPTGSPTVPPSTSAPTGTPTDSPLTSTPTISPSTSAPTIRPSISPSTSTPTIEPSISPSTSTPTIEPSTSAPTVRPSTASPTDGPVSPPTSTPPPQILEDPRNDQYCAVFSITGFADPMRDGLHWYPMGHRPVTGYKTWWTKGLWTTGNMYVLYLTQCDAVWEYRISNEAHWSTIQSNPCGAPFYGRLRGTPPSESRDIIFEEVNENAQVTLQRTVRTNCGGCDAFEASGFTNSALNRWYLFARGQGIGNRRSYRSDGGHYHIFWCVSLGKWVLGQQADWESHRSGSCANILARANTDDGVVQASWAEVTAGGGFVESGALECVTIHSRCDTVWLQARDQTNYLYADPSKRSAEKPTYWDQTESMFFYYCASAGAWVQGRGEVQWTQFVSQGECAPLTGQYSAGTLRKVDGDGDLFSSAGTWEVLDASGIWTPQSDVSAMCQEPTRVVLAGFENTYMNGNMYRVPGKRAGNKATYWNAEDQSFLYYCREKARWQVAPETDWAGVQGGSCPYAAKRYAGHFALPRHGNCRWAEYAAGSVSCVGVSEVITADCQAFSLTQFSTLALNDKFVLSDTMVAGKHIYSTQLTGVFAYWCEAAAAWHVSTQVSDLPQIQNGACPNAARKIDSTSPAYRGGWEEACVPNNLMYLEGAMNPVWKKCPGSATGDYGTKADKAACLAACAGDSGCNHAMWDSYDNSCKKFDTCDPTAYVQDTSTVGDYQGWVIIGRCPASGYHTPTTAFARCEDAGNERTTEQGCTCLKTWQYLSFPEVTNYCGNPGDTLEAPWCFVVDPLCMGGQSWGYCGSDGIDISPSVIRTPSPPFVALTAPGSQEQIRQNLATLSGDCCSNAITFPADIADLAELEKVAGDVRIRIPITYNTWPITSTEMDQLRDRLSQSLGIPAVDLAEINFFSSTAGRGFRILSNGTATLSFTVKNLDWKHGGLNGWHAGLMAATGAVILILCVLTILNRPTGDPRAGLHKAGEKRALIAGAYPRVHPDSDDQETDVMSAMDLGESRTMRFGAIYEMRTNFYSAAVQGDDRFEHRISPDGTTCPAWNCHTEIRFYSELQRCPACGGPKVPESASMAASSYAGSPMSLQLGALSPQRGLSGTPTFVRKSPQDGLNCPYGTPQDPFNITGKSHGRQAGFMAGVDKLKVGHRLRTIFQAFKLHRSARLCASLRRDWAPAPTLRITDLAVVFPAARPLRWKPALQQCSGVFHPASMTAVMGPVSAGKSSLLKAIAGRVDAHGEVRLGSQTPDAEERRRTIGYVPAKNSGLVPTLTVRENVLFAARIKDSRRDDEESANATDALLRYLGLSRVAAQPADERLSSRELKAASLAVELISPPSVLLLDDPVAGMDADSAADICQLLRELSTHWGVTVVASLMQPHSSVLNLFDDLFLLARGPRSSPGGRLIYHGPTRMAPSYFNRVVNFSASAICDSDPARFLMLAASGRISRSVPIPDARATPQISGRALSRVGDVGATGWATCDAEDLEGVWSSFVSGEDWKKERKQLLAEKDTEEHIEEELCDRVPPSCVVQWPVFFNRAMLMFVRNWKRNATDIALVAVAGFYTGLLFVGLEYEGPLCPPPCDMTSVDDLVRGIDEGHATKAIRAALEGGQDPFAFQAGLAVLAYALCSCIENLSVFASIKEVYYLEVSKGLSSRSLFLATDAVNLIHTLAAPVIFLIPYWVWVHGAGPGCAGFWDYYEVLLPLGFACSGLSYLVSIVLPRTNAQLAVVVVVLGMMRIWDVQDLPWLRYFGFMRWAQEAMYLEDYLCLAAKAADSGGRLTVGNVAAQMHDTTTPWDPNGFVEALVWLWAWGFFLRFLSMGALAYKSHFRM
eukprot:Hpha_TRINITY_DN16126_c0_g1::TRINITY_DN16126_c0_g1_i5::g.8441::m.8441